LLKDPWVQVFAFVALLSGGFMAKARLAAPAAPATAAAGAAPASPIFSAEEPPAVGPSRFSPAPAPAPAQSLPAGGVSMGLKPRTPGRWIVDAAGGPDADSAKISDVVASAQDGDVVLIKPGFYGETAVVIDKSITLRGLGADRRAVTISSVGPLTLAVAGGRARLENLTVSNNGGAGATAVAVSKADLTLVDAAVRAPQGQGLRAVSGSIDAASCELEARIALLGEENSRLKLADCSVAGTEAGVLVKALNGPVEAQLSRTKFHDSERAINLEGQARATIDSCDFKLSAPNGGGVFAFYGAQATVRDAKFDLGGTSPVGLYAQKAKITATRVSIRGSAGAAVIANQSDVTLDDATLEFNKNCAIRHDASTVEVRRSRLRRNRCAVGFYGSGALKLYDSDLSGNDSSAPLMFVNGEIPADLKFSGSNNTGVDLASFARRGAPAAAGAPPRAQPRTNEPVQWRNDVFGQYKRRRF